MSSFQALFQWLGGLFCDPPAPGTHEAKVEEYRVGVRLDKERRKPPGERDEELVRTLRIDYRRRQLLNIQALADSYARKAAVLERRRPSASRDCCAATGWARQRVAASYRAIGDYYCQWIVQIREEKAAAEARRPPVIATQPTMRLHLPEALQQQPPRLDMCSACAWWIQKAELNEESCRVHAIDLQERYKLRGMQPAPTTATATAASQGAAAGAIAAAVTAGAGAAATTVAAGCEGQQQQLQWQTVQPQCDGGSTAGDAEAEGSPVPPKQAPLPPQQQQQHASSDQEPEQQQPEQQQPEQQQPEQQQPEQQQPEQQQPEQQQPEQQQPEQQQ